MSNTAQQNCVPGAEPNTDEPAAYLRHELFNICLEIYSSLQFLNQHTLIEFSFILRTLEETFEQSHLFKWSLPEELNILNQIEILEHSHSLLEFISIWELSLFPEHLTFPARKLLSSQKVRI